MSHLLATPHEYLALLCGLTFLLLAGIAAALSQRSAQRLPWLWLLCFGLAAGFGAWLEMPGRGLSGTAGLRMLRLAVLAAGFVGLVEFGRRPLKLGPWRVYLPILVLTALGLLAGRMQHVDCTLRLTLGVPGGALAAVAIWKEASRHGRKERIALWLAALGIAVSVLVQVLVTSSASLGRTASPDPTLPFAGCSLAVGVGRLALAVVALAGVWLYWQGNASLLERTGLLRRWSAPLILVVVAVLGALATGRHPQHESGETYTIATQGTTLAGSAGRGESLAACEVAPASWEDLATRRRQRSLYAMGILLTVVVVLGVTAARYAH